MALPTWLITAGLLAVLLAGSIYIRTLYLGGQFWMDEALTVGISSHSLSAIPGVLRHDGSPPLYYLLLHIWMSVFGASESATHAMSLLFALLTIPIGMWAGWSLFGRRAGYMAATLFAFNAFLTNYSQETRMYSLMGLLGLLATTAFLHAFVFRRRRYLILFAVCQALMFYTHAWGIFYAAGCVAALIPIWRVSEDRRGIVRDAVLAFGGSFVLFLPWLPNFLYQASHTGAPWDHSPRFGAAVQISRDLMGGDRVTVALFFATVLGLIWFVQRGGRRTKLETVMWALIVLPAATLALAWISSQITPAWVSRYMAPILASMLLLAAFGCSRSGVVGVLAVLASILFIVHTASYTPQYKSDMRDVGGEMTPLLHRGDLVIMTQPEQVPLTWYYLPSGLRYASTLGAVSDPRYMDWVNALDRLKHTDWRATEEQLLASLTPGQQVLFLRPLTEGAQNWEAPWTLLVRRRSAQWGSVLQSDPSFAREAWAPHSYRGACCVADSAVLYKKIS
jgi:4-amino-4-deoxy-L-arabinose transferase-like glycosyltransferase